MKPALLVLAAGLGSRYGGFKQIEPLGPNGEFIIDYSIFDALRAGFGPIVIVTQRQLEEPIREHIVRLLGDDLDLRFAFQQLDDLPAGFSLPTGRSKPWGTGHAIRAAREVIDRPFGVINADDYYGARSYQVLGDYLKHMKPGHACMVGFELARTLSDHGSVSRGICKTDANELLVEVVEHTKIHPDGAGDAISTNTAGIGDKLSGSSIASMNMWGFAPAIFEELEKQFVEFLDAHGKAEKSEFFIPSAVDTLIKTGKAKCDVLRTPEQWFGVTYQEDRDAAVSNIRALIENQTYPYSLQTESALSSPYASATP